VVDPFKPFIRLLAAAFLLLAGNGAPAQPRESPAWVGTWASAQAEPWAEHVLANDTLKGATLRQLVRISIGGKRIRLRISNAFGRSPLKVDAVDVALAIAPGSPRIVAATDRGVRFSGERSFAIPAGSEYLSDPVELNVSALATLAISIHFEEQNQPQTGHPGSRATSYVVSGNHVSDADFAGALRFDRWYYLTGVDVEPIGSASSIAIVGDSITDGFGVRPNTNTRWPDFLMERLQASPATRALGVLNLGIGGNRILDDGLGPNAMARFERDVLLRSGVKYLIILEGVNDLGTLTRDAPVSADEHRALVGRMIAAYRQMVARARERGIKVIGATIMPYGGSKYYHPAPESEADRQALNAWIRTVGNVDGVIDFDAAMRDPVSPHLLKTEYDSGDGLHPSTAGYRAMAQTVQLSLFERR
jgi:lysophospholipase L1-like esterase